VQIQEQGRQNRGLEVTIPGNRPLATPSVVQSTVFIGGGFGSHEFYSFDAVTGKEIWQYRTTDDGPTAAVVEDGFIAFNTESCELEILTVGGKPVWKKWLGDPLMSMPAISAGKVYMAFPNSKGDRQHYLACFELKTGKEFWKRPIAGEVITAPIVSDEKVYLSTLEGTVYCFGQHDGELVWKEKKNVTSAPSVWNAQCYFGRRTEVTIKKDGKEVKQQEEQVATRAISKLAEIKDLASTKRVADDLDYERNAAKPLEKAQKAQDAIVGFATAPADAKLGQAMRNLGKGSVCGVWSYQGSKPFFRNGKLYSSMGDTLKCVDPKSEKVIWQQNLHEKKKDLQTDSLTTPPALVNGKVFVGTTMGEVFCIAANTGKVFWTVNLGAPILFQPAAKGRVYVSTNSGHTEARFRAKHRSSLNKGEEPDHGNGPRPYSHVVLPASLSPRETTAAERRSTSCIERFISSFVGIPQQRIGSFIKQLPSSRRLGLGQSIAKRLRPGPLPAADEDPLLAAARERAPERVDVRPQLGCGPAVKDFLARQGRGALAQELPDGFEGGKRGLWRAVRQHDVVGSFRVQLRGDVFKGAGITADAVQIPTPHAPVAGSLQVDEDVGEGGQGTASAGTGARRARLMQQQHAGG
jgi:outer membrane protein assembly factor BamB